MSVRRYIQVLLPLRLKWEPVYYVDCQTESEASAIRKGDRVRVRFAGIEYVAVVVEDHAEKQAEAIGKGRIKPVAGIAADLQPVSPEEVELWSQVSSYYLCTVGEVYKAAYPAQKVAGEEVRSRMETLKAERLAKAKAREEEKRLRLIRTLKDRIARKEEQIEKARCEATRQRYLQEKSVLEQHLDDANLRTGGLPATGGTATGETLAGPLCGMEAPCPSPVHDGGGPVPGTGGRQPVLSEAQEKACSEIKEVLAAGKPALLKGVTGSGKTEIYLKLAKEVLDAGKNVLYMFPEIALSSQLEERIGAVFPAQLQVFHSGETMAQRRAVASSIRQQPYIVLGTRSSVFLPHKDLGLVIIDEEHDTSYKQTNPAPRYNGRETAIMLAGIFGAGTILGSATPSLESLYNCRAGRFKLVTLEKRYFDAGDSDVEIIDTLAERRKNGMAGHFSRKLISHVHDCLRKGRQVVLLRERRSYSPAIQCGSCGDIPKCKRCNVPLSLHRQADGVEKLVCHYCGKVHEYAGVCPECGGTMKLLGAGTQKIEEEARKLFPDARIARLDSDSAQSRKNEADTIRSFSRGEIDILIGTHVVTKGFDFSGLTLVAVLQADSILGQQDYRADERGLQLLEQFRGRCGRRGEKGLFVIQTSQPEHPVYQSLGGSSDKADIVKRFLAERKLFGYPPYSRMIGLTVRDRNVARLELMCRELAHSLGQAGMSTAAKVVGPYSPAVDKISGQHIRSLRVLLPKDPDLTANKDRIAETVDGFEQTRKYIGHISIDVDPV